MERMKEKMQTYELADHLDAQLPDLLRLLDKKSKGDDDEKAESAPVHFLPL